MSIKNFVKRSRDIMRQDAGISGDAQRIEQLAWMLFLKIYDDVEMVWEIEDDEYRSIIPEAMRWRNWADTDVTNKNTLKGDELLDFVNNQLFPTLQNLQIPPNCPKSKSIVKSAFEDIHNFAKDGVQLRELMQLINECDFSDTQESHAFGEIYETILRQLQSAGAAGEFYTPRALTDFMADHVSLKLGDRVADFACGTGGFLNSARRVLNREASAGTNEDRAILSSSFYGIEKKPLPYLLCITNLLLNGVEEPNIRHGNSLTKNVMDLSEADKFDVILMNPPYGGSEKAAVQQNFPEGFRSAETADLFMTLISYSLKAGGRAAVVVPDGFLFGGGAKRAIKERLVTKFNLHTIVRLPESVFSPYTNIATNILFFDNLLDEAEEASETDKTPDGVTNRSKVTQKTWFYRLDMPEGYKKFSKTKPMLLAHLNPLADWWNDRKAIEVDGIYKAKAFTCEELEALDYNLDQCGFAEVKEEILPPKELIAKFLAERDAANCEMDAALMKILELLGAPK